MRRTYRSKKDAGGVIEHRDLLQNLDEKSSAFDAFYIQNIKQTKRELSCVTSSNPVGVASSRIRKRKYVKRIVKEVDSPCRVSLGQLAYLTPDKSIRVNKPMDPFDMLLNSSPANTDVAIVTEAEPESSKRHDLFDKLVPRKEGRKYTRKKPIRPKKLNNTSSNSSDSEKENSDDQKNITGNTTDIKSYKLVIEKETRTIPKHVNDSIHNIVNNLSLLNKLRHKDSFNTSYKTSKFRQRLTNNTSSSPILQKSPLCSTPYKLKYRDPSIYKFSPISITNYKQNVTTLNGDADKSNDSIIFAVKDNSKSTKVDKVREITLDSFDVFKNKDIVNVTGYETIDNKANVTLAEPETPKKVETTPNLFSDDDCQNSAGHTELSSLQTTEVEPFLGFSESAKHSYADNIDEYVNLDHSSNGNDITEIEILHSEVTHDSSDIGNDEESNGNDEIVEDDHKVGDKSRKYDDDYDFEVDDVGNNEMSNNTEGLNDADNNELNNDSEAHSDAENSGTDCSNDELNNDEMGDNNDNCDASISSEFSNGTNVATNYGNNDHSDDENNESNSSDNDDLNIGGNDKDGVDNNASISKNHSVSSSIGDGLDEEMNNSSDDSVMDDSQYDTCTDQSTDDETTDQKELIVKLEKMNDSTFIRYYEKMKNVNFNYGNDHESLDSDEFASFAASSHSNNDDSIDNIDSELADDNEITSSNDDDNSNNDDKGISFVTTRRRNEVTNNSFMSIFNDSYASSSTDCDKTILSNKETDNTDINKDNTKISNSNTNKDLVIVPNKEVDCRRSTTSEFQPLSSENKTPISKTMKDVKEHRQSTVSARFSNITDRRASRRSTLKTKRSPSHRHSKSIRDSIKHNLELSGINLDKPAIVLQPGKKWERSLSIYRRITMMTDHFDHSVLEEESTETKGRKYRQSVISTMEMQDYSSSLHNESINSRRSTFVSKPSRSTIRIVKDPNNSRLSISNTSVLDDLKGFLNEECDDTIIELSKLSIAESHEVTVLNNFNDTSHRIATARDYVLRRCNQTDAVPFDECYPETALKNCHKIGEGVYGEVFLWRDRDGRARVLKIVPIAGTLKVNGESQKDFHEIISEIVIAMELSALRAPIAELERHFDEGKSDEALDLHAIENATDIFNEVLAVRCVYGSYPSRLLDLWDLYDECKGSENDNPAILPPDQQFIVLELANAGQDLESYQFNNAEQAHALFLQVAYGLAVAEEAFQFEHRDLHWGNVLIAPTDQKYATFIVRGRRHVVPRCGVSATIIDYSLSRVSVPLGAERAALYNDLAADESLFDAVGDYQFMVYRLMRDKLGNDWKNFEPYTNILWLHYTVDKMITALRYKRTNTKLHKHYIDKLKGIKSRILNYGSAALFVLTDNEI